MSRATANQAGVQSSGLAMDQIVHLNVGGQRFSTSKSTLTWIPDTFFTSLLSGRISSLEDETGAKFIDRDPGLFQRILNYLRTKQVDLCNVSIRMLLHEAEFYGITPLVKRLSLCKEMNECSCGDVLFHGVIPPSSPNEFPVSAVKRKNRLKIPNQRSGDFTDDCPKDPRVRLIRAHHNFIAIAYSNYVCCYKMKESYGWQQLYVSPKMESEIKHVALLSKFPTQASEKMLALALENDTVHLWCLEEGNDTQLNRKIGLFNLSATVDNLFFIGSQLVALSWSGKVGVWQSTTQNWQVQDVVQISSYDTAGSVLLLGCTNGCIYYIDMQKFPLRMKDNDLLITELYRDPNFDTITAISVYLTPKTTLCGNWIEIAYGTNTGNVRVIVQHPETVGHGPQLFQTYSVHTCPITKVALTTNHLISVCHEYNHVRSWSVTRFRGMISTQPGGQSLASFKVLTLDSTTKGVDSVNNCPGPFGEQDGEQIFVQRVIPETDVLFIRVASTGDRLCTIKSVDGSSITSFYVHESEGSNRMGARPRRYLFTGMSNGSVQTWDLTTAMDQFYARSQILNNQLASNVQVNTEGKAPTASSGSNITTLINLPVQINSGSNGTRCICTTLQGPTPEELLQVIDEYDLSMDLKSVRINDAQQFLNEALPSVTGKFL